MSGILRQCNSYQRVSVERMDVCQNCQMLDKEGIEHLCTLRKTVTPSHLSTRMKQLVRRTTVYLCIWRRWNLPDISSIFGHLQRHLVHLQVHALVKRQNLSITGWKRDFEMIQPSFAVIGPSLSKHSACHGRRRHKGVYCPIRADAGWSHLTHWGSYCLRSGFPWTILPEVRRYFYALALNIQPGIVSVNRNFHPLVSSWRGSCLRVAGLRFGMP